MIKDKRLKPNTFRVLCYLYSQGKEWNVRNKDVMKVLDISKEQTLANYWRNAMETGWLKRVRNKRTNGFDYILDYEGETEETSEDVASKATKEKPPIKPKEPSAKKNKPKTSKNTTPLKNKKTNTGKSNKNSGVKTVFDYWKGRTGKQKAVLGDKRKRAISNALKKYSIDDLKNAIDGCLATPFNMGDNQRGIVYNDIELICRNETNVERFMDNLSSPPKPMSKKDEKPCHLMTDDFSDYDFKDNECNPEEAAMAAKEFSDLPF